MDTAEHKEQSPFSGTSESRKKAGLLHFGGFTLDLQRHGLYRKGDRLHLTPKPFETLAFLVEHRGRTIGKQKLLDAVWKEAFVTEDTLVKAIREIRRVLEDDKENPRFVQTVPGEGYRFIADVTEANQEIEEHLIREHGLAATSARHVAADAEAGEHISSDDSAGSPRIVEPAKQQPQDRPEHKPLEPANPEPADTLRRTVARLTEDEPKRHFRWWAAGVLGLTILVTAVGLYMFPRRDKAIGQGINSLAILPFTNASGDVSAQYLSDGITESLINRFSRLSQLRVTARATVFRYKGQDQDIQAIGRKLNVRAVLTGRVLLRGDSLNIQADLVEVSDGSQLWGEQYHRKIGEILNVQEEIASADLEEIAIAS